MPRSEAKSLCVNIRLLQMSQQVRNSWHRIDSLPLKEGDTVRM